METFASAEDLLQTWPSDNSGCLVVDVQMPGLSGLELQTELATLGSTVPIIFITAHDDPNAKTRALKSGAREFLDKPFDDETLIAAIHAAFEAKP